MSEQDFSQFKQKLIKLGADLDKSSKRVVSQMADVGLAETKKNTPTNKDPHIVGGTLKRGWHKERTLKVGNSYKSKYLNNVYYGLYVNNGHRTVNKSGETIGYVEGFRMLEQGINRAKRQSKTLFNNEIQRAKQKGGW